MGGVVADTHAAVWYLAEDSLISAGADERMRATLAGGDVVWVPSICIVELVYLLEKGRVPQRYWDALNEALRSEDFGYRLAPLDEAVARAVAQVSRSEVPELPDRIIAATALAYGLPLVTRDREIQASGIETIW